MSDDPCRFCGEPHRGYACDHCDELCCDPCLEYRQGRRGEDLAVCPDCVAQSEADAEFAAERAAEHRADIRAADREAEDDRRW